MIAFRPLPAEHFPAWRDAFARLYRDDLGASGRSIEWIERELARVEETVFPGGRVAEGHRITEVLVDGEVAGSVWTGPAPVGDDGPYWIHYIEIDATFRGRGVGRATMVEVERIAAQEGASRIGLAVRTENEAARRLYAGLGYGTEFDNGTRLRLGKAL